MQEYDAADMRAALESALGSGSGDTAIARTILDPQGLATAVALELARSIVSGDKPLDEREQEVAGGTTACLCGLLVSAWLPPADEGLAARILDGVATVKSFGRLAVIAQQCDLAAVAECEGVVGRALTGAAGELLPSTLQLYELGFAIGLGARL